MKTAGVLDDDDDMTSPNEDLALFAARRFHTTGASGFRRDPSLAPLQSPRTGLCEDHRFVLPRRKHGRPSLMSKRWALRPDEGTTDPVTQLGRAA